MTEVLKDWMSDAAAECALPRPSVFAAATTDSLVQLKTYMKRAADELLDRWDWANLTLDGTITGDGGTTYALPSDFRRLQRRDKDDDPAVWSDGMRRAYKPVTSNGEWTALTAVGPTPLCGYRIVGSNIKFTQALASGDTVTVAYVSTKWIVSSSTRVDTWTTDADTTLLPGRLVELGVEWRWKRRRGLEFNSYQAEFEIELSRRSADDRSLRGISFGAPKARRSPYDGVPVPLLGPDPNV